MKPQQGLALVLLLALVAGAAAAGEGAPPAFPHEFYGSVTIDGAPAPAGTVIAAVIDGGECEPVTTTVAGEYGSPSRHRGANLLVWGSTEQAGETVTFLVAGKAATETATYTPGEVTRLDLTVAGSSSGSNEDSGNEGSSSSSPAAPVSSSTPELPAAPATHIGKASLPTTTAGEVTASTTVRTADGTGTLEIPAGTTARDAAGNPLGAVTVARAAEVPAVPPGTTVGIALDCGPAGAVFDPPVTLTYTLSTEEWAKIGGAAPKVMWYNPASKVWQEVPATVDPATRTVTAKVSHFSVYALAWTPTPPAETTAVPAATTSPGETLPDPGPQQPVEETPWAFIAAGTLLVAGGLLAAGWYYRKKE